MSDGEDFDRLIDAHTDNSTRLARIAVNNAFRRGQESMRVRALAQVAQWFQDDTEPLVCAIRALPILDKEA